MVKCILKLTFKKLYYIKSLSHSSPLTACNARNGTQFLESSYCVSSQEISQFRIDKNNMTRYISINTLTGLSSITPTILLPTSPRWQLQLLVGFPFPLFSKHGRCGMPNPLRHWVAITNRSQKHHPLLEITWFFSNHLQTRAPTLLIQRSLSCQQFNISVGLRCR